MANVFDTVTDSGASEHTRAPYHPVGRRAWLGIAFATICVGLGVHDLGFGLPARARDAAGDALWAVMMFAWLGALWPHGVLIIRAALTLGICWSVEVSQAYHAPWLDAIRRTTIGQLVLGSGFDVRDLGSYALGVIVACAIEMIVRRRPRRRGDGAPSITTGS